MLTEYLNTHDLGKMLLPPGSYQPFPRRQDRARWEGISENIKAELLEWGDEARREGFPMLTATQYLAYTRTGDRQVFETPYFNRRRRLIGAVLAECLRDDGTYLDTVIDGLWCICEESSWVVSAHCDSRHLMSRPMMEHRLPDVTDPYIDLFSAQTAATVAFTLYFLEDKLDDVSPRIARRARHELEARILHPFMTHDDFWWMGMIRKDMNNWTPWILSNLLYVILLIERDGVRRCEAAARAMRMMDSYLAVMPEDGGCDEGAGYFNVAGASLFDALDAVYEATGGRVSFFDEPLIRNIGLYPVNAHIAGPYYLNFADCDAQPIVSGTALIRYGKRIGSEQLIDLGASIRQAQGGRVREKDTPQMNRVLYGVFDPIPQAQEPAGAPFVQMPLLQVFAWNKGELFAAVKGGHNGESHNHNDVGAFVVYVGGEPQVIDMGNKVYTAKTFGPERYTIDNTRSMNHNLPLIGGAEQAAGRKYAAWDVQADEHGAQMDIAGAYPEEAGVKRLVRTLSVEEGCVTLHDSAALDRAQEVTWVFMLRNEPDCQAGRVRSGRIELDYDVSLDASVAQIPVTDARLARNFPGSLWRLTLTAKAADTHEQTFTVRSAEGGTRK